MDKSANERQPKYRKDYRAPDYLITDTFLCFSLDPERTRVEAVLHIRRNGSHTRPLVLDGVRLELESVEINGAPAEHILDSVSMTLPDVPAEFDLRVVNYLAPAKVTDYEGLYMSEGILCTQCEAEGFRKITYYLDRPDVSSRFTVRMEADRDAFPHLLSNGNRAEQGDLGGGRHYAVRKDPFAKPSYLFALVAGRFDVLADTFVTAGGRKVDLEFFVNRGDLDLAGHAMASLKRAMKWDEDRFGLECDLDLFQVVAVDFFNMGAMENKGLNIFNSKYVLANRDTATDGDCRSIENVIGHEYFHNWTGNRVTCRDWFQLSLKEGLTVFRDQEFSADMGSPAAERIRQVRTLRTVQYPEDAGPMAHPVRPDKVIEQNNFYSATVYEKGAEVVRMLQVILGRQCFREGLACYLSRFDGSCATCEDFVDAMQDTAGSGIDLSVFRRWYSCSGTPLVAAEEEYDPVRKVLTVRLRQRHRSDDYTDRSAYPPLCIPLKFELLLEDGTPAHLADGRVAANGLFLLDSPEATLEFTDIPSRPAVSYLTGFSAPVILERKPEYALLERIASFSRDGFNRYEALNELLADHFARSLLGDADRKPEPPEALIRCYRRILEAADHDGEYLAMLLEIPSEQQLAVSFPEVEAERIHRVCRELWILLAGELEAIWLRVYHEGRRQASLPGRAGLNARELSALALRFLCLGGRPQAGQLALAQFEASSCMTDTMAAMQAAVLAELPEGGIMLKSFRERWQGRKTVMDKWLALQAQVASEKTLDNVRELMKSDVFDFTNPNRIRSLVGVFTRANPYAFHVRWQETYRFLGETVACLNARNPQIASVLVDPMLQFRRLHGGKGELMRLELEKLAALPDLAPDLYEKISRALKPAAPIRGS